MLFIAQIFALLTVFSLPISTTATAILMPLTLVLALTAGRWRERENENIRLILYHPASQTFGLLSLLFLIGLIDTIAPFSQAMTYLVKHYWVFFAPLLLIVWQEKKWRDYTVNSLIIAMLITLIFAYAKFFNWYQPHFTHISSGRETVFKDHIVQNSFMAFAASLLLYRVLFETRHRFLYSIFILLMSIDILLMSDGRTGYLLYLVLVTYLCGLRFGFKGLILMAILGLSVMGLAYHFSADFHESAGYAINHIMQFHQTHQSTSEGIRIKLMENAYFLFKQHPWFGFGTGSIHAAYATLPKSRIDWIAPGVIMYDFSNIYLNFLVQFGCVGLGVLLFVLGAQWYFSLQLPLPEKIYLQLALLSLILGGIPNSWLTDTTHAHWYALWSMLCFAALPRKQS